MAFHLPSIPFTEAGWVFAVLALVILGAPLIAGRLRMPDIVGLVLAGMVVGPNVAGLLEYGGAIELMGSVGLLYLMFVAGLELDLDDFRENRRGALTFGAITFAVPMLLGAGVIYLMGYPVLAAILLASCWASHTLVAYPVFRRFGAVRNRAVTTSVGATIITDTAALLVLAVVAGAHRGSLGPLFWLTLIPGLAALVFFTTWVLPRLARYSFATFAQDRLIRFAFLLAALFVTSGFAELAGIEAIVGAFLAGLALNRLVPEGSLLMERVEFLGSSLLIPLFLVSVGMLVDPALAFTDPASLATAGGFIAVALGAKLLAAVLAGRMLRYGGAEIGAMFSLSSAQAAATLAAVVVGLNIGLLDRGTVNAVILVILVTCLVSSWTANRYAPRLERPDDDRDLGQTVVVPMAEPAFAKQLLRLAATIARADAGLVVPVTVVPPSAAPETLADIRRRNAEGEAQVLSTGADARAIVRIDASPKAGVAHTIVEQSATSMVLGWRGHERRDEALFGTTIDPLVADLAIPMVIARPTTHRYDRIVLAVSESNTSAAGTAGLCLALEVIARLRTELGLPVVVVSNSDDAKALHMVEERLGVGVQVDRRRRSIMLRHVAEPNDLLVVPVKPERAGLHGAASRIARAVPDNGLIITLDPGGRTVRTIAQDMMTPTAANPTPGRDVPSGAGSHR
ncbi:MAG TPA: cation:proton antiporter [Egibacteraceae bacterium]|nr:cation:proton antiporter [Egibacteraceae bacterium]